MNYLKQSKKQQISLKVQNNQESQRVTASKQYFQ